MTDQNKLNARQHCPCCGRNYAGEDAADVVPGAVCPSDECPGNEVTRENAKVGMICVDRTDGQFVKLDRPHNHRAWECAVWCNNHWSYEGDRIHLSDLVRVPNAIETMRVAL